MKYFIVSDVHSFFTEFLKAITDAGFDKENLNHTLVVLGDLFDRGPEAAACLKYINSLDRKILIRGNHEDLLEDAIYRKDFTSFDYTNGTADTLYQLTKVSKPIAMCYAAQEHEELNKYLNSLVDYYELENSIFVHGWIPCESNDPNKYHALRINYKFDADWRNGNWKYARWINGMEAWNQGIRVPGKTIYCGHWNTSWGHSMLHNNGPEYDTKNVKAIFEPFIDTGIVALDACTAYSHKVNCVVIDDNEIKN